MAGDHTHWLTAAHTCNYPICRAGPGAFVSEHHGQAGRLRAHIGLEVPAECGMRVAGQDTGWEELKAMVFDGPFLAQQREFDEIYLLDILCAS